jgi:hypothetical protein
VTISYPREIPFPRLVECSFELLDGVTTSPSARGKFLNRSQVVEPMWKAVISTPPLNRADRAIWGAWKKSLRGGLRSFVAYDLTKSPPRAYPAATSAASISGAWDGTGTVTSIGTSGNITLGALPAGYKAMVGDHLALEENGKYGFYEILEDKTANGSGVVTLTVAPFIHTTLFSTAATARLWQPKAEFIIDWQSWKEQATLNPTPISFEAYQVL